MTNSLFGEPIEMQRIPKDNSNKFHITINDIVTDEVVLDIIADCIALTFHDINEEGMRIALMSGCDESILRQLPSMTDEMRKMAAQIEHQILLEHYKEQFKNDND